MIDDDLAGRIRDLLTDEPGITEKRMFGGLAFLVDGKMAVAVGGEGALLARVDAADYERLAATDGVDTEVMNDRTMRGWLEVSATRLQTDDELTVWLRRGVAVARAAPAKKPTSRTPRRSGR